MFIFIFPGADSSTSHTFNRRLPKSKIISLKLTFGIILSKYLVVSSFMQLEDNRFTVDIWYHFK